MWGHCQTQGRQVGAHLRRKERMKSGGLHVPRLEAPNIWNIAVAASGFSAVAAGTCAFCSAAVTGTPSAGAAISAERDAFTVADVPAARGPNMLNKPVGTTCGGPAGLEPSAAFWIVAGGV